MLVDLSHVSVRTMQDAISHSVAPVIFSHSSAYSVYHHERNVPDSVLKRLADKDGVVMINFYKAFVTGDEECTVDTVAEHVLHVAKVAGWKYTHTSFSGFWLISIDMWVLGVILMVSI